MCPACTAPQHSTDPGTPGMARAVAVATGAPEARGAHARQHRQGAALGSVKQQVWDRYSVAYIIISACSRSAASCCGTLGVAPPACWAQLEAQPLQVRACGCELVALAAGQSGTPAGNASKRGPIDEFEAAVFERPRCSGGAER